MYDEILCSDVVLAKLTVDTKYEESQAILYPVPFGADSTRDRKAGP
jgi:hypothetical protein